jgi:hypothetical protein
VHSEDHLGVLDEIVTVAALDNGINPGVVSSQEIEGSLNLLLSLLVFPQVSGLGLEEVGTETIVSVQQDTVDVVVALGGDILNEELNLIDQVSSLTLSSLDGFAGLVEVFDSVLCSSGLNLGNVEAGSEGVSGKRVGLVEEVMESSDRERLMLLVDLSEDDWGESSGVISSVVGLDLSLLLSLVIRDLATNGVGELGGADESHDVGVVLEDQNLLMGGGLIIGGGSNLDNGSLFEVGELDSQGKSVESGTGGVLQFQLVGVLVKLEDLEDLSNNIEIRVGAGSLLKRGNSAVLDDVVLHEEGVGPLLEGLDNSQILGLLSGLLARVSIRGISDDVTERAGLLR